VYGRTIPARGGPGPAVFAVAGEEDARLITTLRRGREKLHHLDAEPINAIADRWISRYDRERAHALADLKAALEAPAMDSDSSSNAFVYTTYIDTTPEKLWQALTDPAFTRRYWGVEFGTDWTSGSRMTWSERGYTTVDPEQVVLESDPYRRLSYTWHTFTPGWARAVGIGEDALGRLMAEQRSGVTFEITPVDGMVCLTVVHDGFEPGSTVREMIREGWPALLPALKSLLETGAVPPALAPGEPPTDEA
jgi:uncharacterized protein YndB with AHSA1/START domain